MNPANLYLVVLLPLAGFLVNGLVGKRLGRLLVSVVGCGTLIASFVLSLLLFLSFDAAATVHLVQYRWMEAGALQLPVAFALDPLSITMLLIITGVGSLIHLYATGYMKDDPGYNRFFAYLNLFVFFMLVLVLADNLVVMFVGWEGVGLCSYLLIGYYYDKPSAARAGLKAFLVNRVGDFGFVLAILAALASWGTASMSGMVAGAQADADAGMLWSARAVAMLLFFAATGKSAQIPLYVWLPDAMEGPTPVSALIHAATMVTSGVYLTVRLSALYALVPDVLGFIAIIGALTAFVAATMALVERDIKRILAYSTISQLGYMFLGVGAGAAAAGMFHLTTHAFFKACLFLAAGSVMHGLHGELDIHKMGGLRKRMPITWLAMLFATLAITGFPGTAGFVSKDAILWHAHRGHDLVYWAFLLGVATVALTSFYMFRMLFSAFHGAPRDQHLHEHAHESPLSMWGVLVVLALLSLGAGALNWPTALGGGERFAGYLAGTVSTAHAEHATGAGEPAAVDAGEAAAEHVFSAVLFALALAGAVLAWVWYGRRSEAPARWAKRLAPLYLLVGDRKWYVDRLYQAGLVRGTLAAARFLWLWIDDVLIDGTVNMLGLFAQFIGEFLRLFQTGLTRNYALSLFLGSLGVLVYLVVWAY